MPNAILGLRTTIYKVTDLAAAKEWYARAFRVEPYFDEPFYVGFSVAGYELDLLPDAGPAEAKTANVLSYWGVEDIQAKVARFSALGATEDTPPTNLGG